LEGERKPEEQSSSQDPSPPTPPIPQGLDHQKDKLQEKNLTEQAEEKNWKVDTGFGAELALIGLREIKDGFDTVELRQE